MTITDTTPSGSVTPAAPTFDKNTTKQADIAAVLDTAGYTLKGIKLGNSALIEGADYTTSGSLVTFLKTSLAGLETGIYNVVFDLSAGTDPVMILTVVDTSIAKGSIKIQMYNGTTSAQSISLSPKFKIFNNGTTGVKLSDVKVRYYYTINGESDQNFWCDWSSIGSSNITGTLVKMPAAKTGADYYLEIGFASEAGNLAAGEYIEVQVRVTKSNWTNYTQTDDYSFEGSAMSYVDWPKVTGYISSSLKWGIEP